MAESSSTSTEELLDRMLTRLAFCDDSNLEALISKLLPLTISSLSSSPSNSLRNKALEILSHVNKRVKHQPEIRLPLAELWKMYTEPNAAPMVKNFCIVYIEMAFERAHLKEKEDMAPELVRSISKLPQQHQDIILRIAVRVIGECHASGIDDEVAAKYRLISGLQDREQFIEICLHSVLYQMPSQGGESPPGLSVAQANRVTGKHPLKKDVILTIKLGILNVIEAMEMEPELVYPLYLSASVDCQEPVVRRGEELLKKKAFAANLDDQKLINKLFLLFNGTVGAENIAPEFKVSPGNAALKAKLMSIFCRSITAANSFPATLQCIFGCMYDNNGEKIISRKWYHLKAEAAGNGIHCLGFQTCKDLRVMFCIMFISVEAFTEGDCSTPNQSLLEGYISPNTKQIKYNRCHWLSIQANLDQIKLMGPVILNGILKFLDGYSYSESDAIARETKSFSFQAIGLLAQRLPQLFRDKIEMAVRLFDALKVESPYLRLVIQEATSALAIAYKVILPHSLSKSLCESLCPYPNEGAPPTVLTNLEKLLLNNFQVEQSEVRFCAVRWATSLFDLQHCPSRFVCMLGAADSKLDIR
ncbi:hypothetical protein Patl1_05581 [Pistacia atlantica]|uniref:Uncharacterized protein n=1 Tax=Pistacia atlantica TaxID=434234 RepID=A0ACC1BT45_9ROSI|nr:hypothetical protein Patl1_05581 [Pistacia atlantica]